MDEQYEGIEVLMFDRGKWVSLYKVKFIKDSLLTPKDYIKEINECRDLFFNNDRLYIDVGTESDIDNYTALSIDPKDKMFKFRLY